MTATMQWFKVWALDFLNDDKFDFIATSTGEDRVVVSGVFVNLLCLANDSPRGKLAISNRPLPTEGIAAKIGIQADRLQRIIDEMIQWGMLIEDDDGILNVANWEERQKKSAAAERMAKWRSKKDDDAAPKVVEQNDDVVAIVNAFTSNTGFLPTADPTQYEQDWTNYINEWLMLGTVEQVESWVAQAVRRSRENNFMHACPRHIDGSVRHYAGTGDLKKYLDEFLLLVAKHGARSVPKWTKKQATLAQIIESAGGWQHLCQLNERASREQFTAAYNRIKNV